MYIFDKYNIGRGDSPKAVIVAIEEPPFEKHNLKANYS